MGLLDRFRGAKETERRIERIRFEDLPSWIIEQRATLTDQAKDAGKSVDEVHSATKELADKLGGLEKAKIGDGIHQRIASTVSSSRDNYIARIRKHIEAIDKEFEPLKLNKLLENSLTEITRIDVRYGERAKMGFPNEVSKVKKELNKLVNSSHGLNKSLSLKKEALTRLGGIEKGLSRTVNQVEGLRGLEQRAREAEEELNALRDGKDRAINAVDNIEHSDRAEKSEALRSELARLNARKQELETLILNILGPLKRVFKKYAKAVSEGRAGGQGIERYAEDPVDTYLRGEPGLPELFAKMQKAIQTGVVGIDKNEGDKALKKIRAISFSYLEKARSEYNEVVLRIRSLDMRLKELSISREVERMQSEIESYDSRIEETSKNVQRLKEEAEEALIAINDSKESLEAEISDFIGGKCEIEWNKDYQSIASSHPKT